MLGNHLLDLYQFSSSPEFSDLWILLFLLFPYFDLRWICMLLWQFRAAIEYEKKGYAENYEHGQAMEKKLISMARELEKLRAEIANAEKRARAAAAVANTGMCGLCDICVLRITVGVKIIFFSYFGSLLIYFHVYLLETLIYTWTGDGKVMTQLR